MSERDLLREAFERHENETPDPAVVYAQVQQLAKGYRLRRWGGMAAGGAVLGAGLIAGAIQIPQLLPGPTANGVDVVMPAGPAPSVSAGPSAKPGGADLLPIPAEPASPAELKLQKEWDAYFQAGYHYDDAVRLAKLWKLEKREIGDVKALAGKKLLAGETLPYKPLPYVEAPPAPEESVDPKVTAAFDAYFAAGYDWTDAEKLAKLWKLDDPAEAKVAAGKQLLAGKKLPIQP